MNEGAVGIEIVSNVDPSRAVMTHSESIVSSARDDLPSTKKRLLERVLPPNQRLKSATFGLVTSLMLTAGCATHSTPAVQQYDNRVAILEPTITPLEPVDSRINQTVIDEPEEKVVTKLPEDILTGEQLEERGIRIWNTGKNKLSLRQGADNEAIFEYLHTLKKFNPNSELEIIVADAFMVSPEIIPDDPELDLIKEYLKKSQDEGRLPPALGLYLGANYSETGSSIVDAATDPFITLEGGIRTYIIVAIPPDDEEPGHEDYYNRWKTESYRNPDTITLQDHSVNDYAVKRYRVDPQHTLRHEFEHLLTGADEYQTDLNVIDGYKDAHTRYRQGDDSGYFVVFESDRGISIN